jgi:MSHA pilin protein MshC
MNLQEKYNAGFTLIELVAVIVLLSILGVVAMSRLGNFSGIETRVFYDEVVNAVRYAQKLAISTGCAVQVDLTATGYALHQGQASCTDALFTRDVVNPVDRGSAYANANNKVTISPVAQLEFSAQSSVTNLVSDQTFSVNGRTFTVFRHTGLIDAP